MMISIARFILITISLIVAFFAVKYALANLAYLKVDAYLVRWQESKQLSNEELEDALSASKTMLSLHGHHPHYLNMAAKVYEWKAYKNKNNKTVATESLMHALSLYKSSIELRSHWPLTWVYMADVKIKMGKLDSEFYHYVNRAIRYGPYTKEVNLQISKFFLLFWGKKIELPLTLGMEQIKRALQNNNARYELLKYAKSIGKERVACTIAKLNHINDVANNRVCKAN